MKSAIVLVLPAVISAAVLENRQAGVTFKSTPLESQKWRPTSKRTMTRIGPIVLKQGLSGRTGYSMDPNGQASSLNIPKGTFCGGKDCTIYSALAALEYENGTVALPSTGVYIHHILSFNQGKTIAPWVSRCDTKGDVNAVKRPAKGPAGFAGVSDDNGNIPVMYGTKDGSIEGGYHFKKSDALMMQLDLVNLEKVQKNLYLTYDIEYVEDFVGVDSSGTLLSVTGCGGNGGIDIGTVDKPANTTSGKFRLFQDGFLVNGKGHLHDGGDAMDLYINDKYACTSNALYGGPLHTTNWNGKVWETIAGMTACPGPFPVKDGDYLSMVSRYDVGKRPLRENGDHKHAEVMGMWTMNFMPKV